MPIKNLCYWILLLYVSAGCQAQDRQLLIDERPITDWSEYPVYQQLVVQSGDKVHWREDYKYLDSIKVSGITYMSDGLKINGIMARPTQAGLYPCIIYNRGGNKSFGSLKMAHGALLLGRVASKGYVVIASQYRGNGGSEGEEEFGGEDLNDVLVLPEVLGEISHADTSKIGMYGWSRGGMMTYMALVRADRIDAAVVGGAPTDCYSLIEDRPEMESMVLAELIPDYWENKSVELERRSAIKWTDKFKKDVPILILHGNADWRVKAEQSLRFALELEKQRVPYRLILFEGADHGISEYREEVNAQIINWFDRFLKEGEPVPDMQYHGR